MKKNIVFTMATLILASVSANAYVDNQYMTTPQYLLNTGYSSEMSKVLGMVAQDPYREPYQEPKDPVTVWKRIYNYVAPTMYTDLSFYNSNIHFNTTDWKDY